MADRLIAGIVTSAPSFRRTLARIRDKGPLREIREALGALATADLDRPPAFLHLHQLTGKKVSSSVNPGTSVPVWTIHVTRDDAYKASFTLEGGIAYMRLLDMHAQIDKSP